MTHDAHDLDATCDAEIHALHHAFEAWFDGRSSPADFARIEQALDADFVMIDPRGARLARHDLLEGLRSLHASQEVGALRLHVTDVQLVRLDHDLRLARYVEHHEGLRASQRRSTALFRRDARAPGGVRWLHVHETWIEGHAPAS